MTKAHKAILLACSEYLRDLFKLRIVSNPHETTYLCMYCNVHMSYFEASARLEFQSSFDNS